MAARLTPIGWITKFVLVPAALAALGFYVIGPRIGLAKGAAKVQPIDDASSDAPPPAKPSSSPVVQDHAPDGVEVTTRPNQPAAPNLGQDSDASATAAPDTEDTPKPRKRRHKKPPQSMAAPATDPSPDDGGSAGDTGTTQPETGTTGSTTGG